MLSENKYNITAELLMDDNGATPTMESDIYAFGLLAVEVRLILIANLPN